MNNKLINTIVESRLNQVLINELDSYLINDVKEAYNLQEIVNKKLSSFGLGEVIGYKIGCTNKSIQKELGVNNPIFGPIFKNKIINNNKNIFIKEFTKVGVECEIYIKISNEINENTNYNINNIRNFIGNYGVSLELVENRFFDIKKSKIEYVIIDGSLGNSIILGKEISDNSINFSKLVGRLFINNKEVYSNFADTILGDPLNALLWYFDQKLSLNKFVKKGEIISLGSITPLLWIDYPCKVEAAIDGLGKCSINFIN
jgi:2-keto-4-pentenoate hydratase